MSNDQKHDVKIAKIEQSLMDFRKSFDEWKDDFKTTNTDTLKEIKLYNDRLTTIETKNKMMGLVIKASLPILLAIIGFSYGIILKNIDQKIELSKENTLKEVSLLLDDLILEEIND